MIWKRNHSARYFCPAGPEGIAHYEPANYDNPPRPIFPDAHGSANEYARFPKMLALRGRVPSARDLGAARLQACE
jgi:hypothetical protein